jgi:hypothetical protein
MGILDIFKQAVNPAPASVQATNPNVNPGIDPNLPTNNMGTPGNIPPAANTNSGTAFSGVTAPNGTVPATNDATAAASPLDEFAKLWDTDPNAASGATPYFNVNMEALNKAAAGQDFTSGITPEHLAAIAGGGEGAVKAFADAINASSRDVYARSALATTKIVESALAKAETKFNASVPGMIKQHGLQDGLRSENPAFSHPAAQPIIGALEKQLTQKYPNATANELRNMATQYLTSFSAAIGTPTTNAATHASGGSKPSEMDWTTFL